MYLIVELRVYFLCFPKIPLDRYPQVKDTKGRNMVIPKNVDDDLLYKIKNINVEIGYEVQIFLLNQFEDHQCFFSLHKSNCSGLSNKNTLFKYSLKSV